jgi:hypothetical protein
MCPLLAAGRNGTQHSEVEVHWILDQGLTGSDTDLAGERPHPSAPTLGRHEVTKRRGDKSKGLVLRVRVKVENPLPHGLDQLVTWKSRPVNRFDELAFKIAEPTRYQAFIRRSLERRFRLL